MSETRRVTSTRSTPRRATRAHARPDSRGPTMPIYRHPLVLPLLLFVACLLFLASAFGGMFTVRQVQVVGTGLPTSQIIAASGLQGKNIFRIRSDSVVARLQAVRQIVVSEVDTEFPDRVIIHARLRTRFAAWRRGSQLYIVDPQGNIVAPVATTTLPIIVGPAQGETLGPGVVQAVQYAQTVLPTAPYGHIATFEFGPKHGLTIIGVSGWHAIVGTGQPATLDMRIAELAAVLRKKGADAATLRLINLRQPEPYSIFAPVP
jgi:cell division septal protein FtsQ